MEDSLEKLAARITTSAKALSSIVSASDNSHLNANGLVNFSQDELAQKARQDISYAAREMLLLVSEPNDYLEQHQVNYQQLSCLKWLLHFDIFKQIPLNEPIPFSTVAKTANVPISRLKSVVRMTITGGILTEPRSDYLAHSRLSAQFATNDNLIDWAKFMTEYSAPTASKFAEATARWGDTSEKNQTAYNIAFGTDLPFFGHLAQSQERTANFAAYMRSLSDSQGVALRHILTGFNWSSFEKANVVDVGGSTGQASSLLATHFPKFSFLVQDLPETIINAPKAISGLDPGISSRISFSPHDFRNPQPSSVALHTDIFFLRKIIHDWPSRDARIILSHLSEALQKPGACIVIMDTILPEPGSVPASEEASLRVRDLTMAQSFNSGERELSEWVELFESATPKLRLKEWKKPQGSVMSMMVVVRD
ncbi:hypothetical protein SBOR_0326 [Sclerotinia borealis F-4128]|uniref:O-methyltransferase C-terminal domain-containing protein n=1 Tax=Sclerotinia borealis (strain F-4128) TaxID=1432307 RepID=W9CXE7_SCLBF|nr:hypothetical protein SBOR_0326 [Sclerotinia borealis F-4128]